MNFNDQNRNCHAERVSRSPERSEGEASLCPSSQTLRFPFAEFTLERRAQGFGSLRVIIPSRSCLLKLIIGPRRMFALQMKK